jgi:hypothetical protein
MKLTHHVRLLTETGIDVEVGVTFDGVNWVDSTGNKYDTKTGEQIDSTFSVIQLDTLRKQRRWGDESLCKRVWPVSVRYDVRSVPAPKR